MLALFQSELQLIKLVTHDFEKKMPDGYCGLGSLTALR